MTVWLSRAAAEEMLAQGNTLAPFETGGVLLGWRDGHDRIVTRVTGPGPAAMHGRFALIPDHGWQVEQIHSAFRETNGDLDYLGDWHTHPDGKASMSRQDDRTLLRIGLRAREPLMVIAVPDLENPAIGAWMEVEKRWHRPGRIETQSVRIFDAPTDWPQ